MQTEICTTVASGSASGPPGSPPCPANNTASLSSATPGSPSDAIQLWYFAYGSNMDLERMERRLAHSMPSRCSGTLRYHRVAFNKRLSGGSGAANIVPSAGDCAYGILYPVIARDLDVLDAFEGIADGHYERRSVVVGAKVGDEPERPVVAFTYTGCSDRLDDSLRPTRTYIDHLLAGQEFLPKLYVKGLRRLREELDD